MKRILIFIIALVIFAAAPTLLRVNPVKAENLVLKAKLTKNYFVVKVTGTVKDKLGNPIPGVGVHVQSSVYGTATDAQGKYVIYCAGGDILEFIYIGMTTINRTVTTSGTTQTIDVVLEEAE